MRNALENPGNDPTFLEYFGLTRPAFARLKNPIENFQTEQYSTLMEHLAAATENPDCLVMISGVDGAGKTTLLNQFIFGLDNDTSYATVDENCSGEEEFYCSLLRQLGFRDITGKPGELRRIAKEFLVHRGIASDPVLIIVDNAHQMSPTVLEQLRWISATKVKDHRVLSVVLAGSTDLGKIMDSQTMGQIAFRSQVDFNIRVYSEAETTAYIKHRLKLAGNTNGTTFADDAYALICRYTGGTPSHINLLCNALLSKAYALASPVVDADLVRSIADTKRLVPHVIPLKGKGRRTTDPDYSPDAHQEEEQEERIVTHDTSATKAAGRSTSKPASRSEEKPAAPSALGEIGGQDLLKQISLLSEQIGEVKADKKRALKDLEVRDKELEKLKRKLDDQAESADERVVSIDVIDEQTAELKNEIEKQSEEILSLKSELASRDDSFTNIELQLQQSKLERETLQSRADALKDLDEFVPEIDPQIDELKTELQSRDLRIAELEIQIAESLRESKTMQTLAAAQEESNESGHEKDQLIATLQSELRSCSEEIMALEARNEELELRDLELAQAENHSVLESELRDTRQRLVETQAELADALKSDQRKPKAKKPKPKSQSPKHSTAPQSPEAGDAAFEIVRAGKLERILEVPEDQPRIMIGRSSDSDLRLKSGFVSRHHALILFTDEGMIVEDLNSFNGTIVNSKKITRCAFGSRDEVIIGDYRIRRRVACDDETTKTKQIRG